MKSFIATLILFFGCISSGYAQMSDEEYETENAKLKVQIKELRQREDMHRGNRNELWDRLMQSAIPDEEKELRKKIAVAQDSLDMLKKKFYIIYRQSDSLKIKWARGVLPPEESSAFVKRLLTIGKEGDRRDFRDEFLRSIWKQDSIAGISKNNRSRRIKAFLYFFRVYEQKDLEKLKAIKKVTIIRD